MAVEYFILSIDNRYLEERERTMGNDVEMSGLLPSALIYIVSNNLFANDND